MARYWVSLGIGACEPDESHIEPNLAGLSKELENLSNHINDSYSYITEDLEDAKETVRKAVEIYKKYGIEADDCGVHITKQPECPKCHFYGRFSDEYCPKCGTKLIPKEDVLP